MNTKNKFIIIGICIIIVIAVLAANIIRRIKTDEYGETEELVKEKVISKAEAYRLLSYLEYDRASREALSMEIHIRMRICQAGMTAMLMLYIKWV